MSGRARGRTEGAAQQRGGRAAPAASTRRSALLRSGCAALVAGALAVAASGCGGTSAADDGTIHADPLTVYASIPLEGPERPVALDVLHGERLALRDAGGRAGAHRVRLVALDAATLQAGGWDPGHISQNARRVAKDHAAVAYLGELDVGSSAISIPLLNESGLLQVSPLDTAMALTVTSTAVAGSPQRYYPNQQRFGRTFARVVPSDRVQARALLRWMAGVGVHRLALLSDEDTTQLALLDAVLAGAHAHGIAVVASQEVDAPAPDHRDLVAAVLAHRPDAVLYAGAPLAGGVAQLWRELAAAAPALKLFVPGALADAAFVAGIGPAAAITYATRPLLALGAYPPSARRFARAFARAYGVAPGPEALYGYEAMAAALAAIDRAQRGGQLTRAAVVRAFFSTRRRSSVLGPYAIDRAGDTSLRRYGAYRIVAGRLRFTRTLDG